MWELSAAWVGRRVQSILPSCTQHTDAVVPMNSEYVISFFSCFKVMKFISFISGQGVKHLSPVAMQVGTPRCAPQPPKWAEGKERVIMTPGALDNGAAPSKLTRLFMGHRHGTQDFSINLAINHLGGEERKGNLPPSSMRYRNLGTDLNGNTFPKLK